EATYGSATNDDSSASLFLPEAKIGSVFYMTGFISAPNDSGMSIVKGNGHVLSGVARIDSWPNGDVRTSRLSPITAYAIDSKIDDGMPNTRKVLAHGVSWAATASSSVCKFGSDANYRYAVRYNIDPATGGTAQTCMFFYILM